MKTPAPHRKRRAALWLMVAASLSVVGGTVLLSNDMRNLRTLAARFGYELPDESVVVHTEVETTKPPIQPNPAPVRLDFSKRLLEAPRIELAGGFLRTWRTTGPTMCEALRKAGIETTPWRPSAFGSSAYECSFQEVYKQDEERPLSSVFLIVRGDRKGAIFNMRAKIVGPATDGAGRLDPSVMRIFDTMLAQPHWLDFSDTLAAIREMKDVKEDGFGASVSFTREFTSENSFNFIVTIKAAPGPQLRTRAYFSRERWMTAPDVEASENLPQIFGRLQR
ncbi:exopolysaccharide biosynthesis protein [Rhizobium sp. P32RR-XVIII]|nr:exopolysaccharide biosynthesis protein [Rhizobium sp. P32RR-XVIII]